MEFIFNYFSFREGQSNPKKLIYINKVNYVSKKISESSQMIFVEYDHGFF